MSLAIDIFYDELSELLELPIYIGEGEDELEKEVTENTHGIAVNFSISDEVEAEDLQHFVTKLKDLAKTTISNTNVIALSFYLWHEDGQFWYSFVNAKYARMPFADEFEAADCEEEVINDYLNSLKKNGVQGKMYIQTISKS